MESEEKIGEMGECPAEKKSCITHVWIFIICIIVAGIFILAFINPPQSCGCEPCLCNEADSFRVDYLIPEECEDCNTSFIEDVSNNLGITIRIYETDNVRRPSILIFNGDGMALADASTRFNILNSICEFSGLKKACNLRDSFNNEEMEECLGRYNVTLDSMVFFHSQGCGHCKNMMPWVEDVKMEEYSVLWIDVTNDTMMNLADECLSGIIDLKGGVPQFACPATGKMHIGEFMSKKEMIEFASECLNSTSYSA
jgi:hypothetical protein